MSSNDKIVQSSVNVFLTNNTFKSSLWTTLNAIQFAQGSYIINSAMVMMMINNWFNNNQPTIQSSNGYNLVYNKDYNYTNLNINDFSFNNDIINFNLFLHHIFIENVNFNIINIYQPSKSFTPVQSPMSNYPGILSKLAYYMSNFDFGVQNMTAQTWNNQTIMTNIRDQIVKFGNTLQSSLKEYWNASEIKVSDWFTWTTTSGDSSIVHGGFLIFIIMDIVLYMIIELHQCL